MARLREGKTVTLKLWQLFRARERRAEDRYILDCDVGFAGSFPDAGTGPDAEERVITCAAQTAGDCLDRAARVLLWRYRNHELWCPICWGRRPTE
jgi:hypothetical protein